MIITVGCPTCGHRYDVQGRLAGKKVRCKDCATIFRVPVPVTLPADEPRQPKRRKPAFADDSLAELLDSPSPSSPAPPATGSRQAGSPSDPGERRGYRVFQGVAIAAFVVFWGVGWGSRLKMAIGLCVLIGGFLLLPIMAGWKSFDRTRRVRWLGAVVGLEGAKAVQATLAIALWVFALLIGMDTIHIQALESPEPSPPEVLAKPEPARPPAQE